MKINSKNSCEVIFLWVTLSSSRITMLSSWLRFSRNSYICVHRNQGILIKILQIYRSKLKYPIVQFSNVAKSDVGSDGASKILTCEPVSNIPKKDIKNIPGPTSLPIIGTLWKYLPIIGEYRHKGPFEKGLLNYKKYGKIVKEEILPGVNIVFLFDPDDIEAVMRNSGEYPERRSHVMLHKYRKLKPDVYNSGGLLPTNGLEWWKIRSLFQKPITSPRNASVYIDTTNSVVSSFVEKIRSNIKDGHQENDFLNYLSRLNLQLICIIAFDVKLDSFSDEEMLPDSLSSKLMEATIKSNYNTLITDSMPEIFSKMKTKWHRQLIESQDFLEKVAIDFISQKMKDYKENDAMANATKEKSLLQIYLSTPEIDMKDIVGMSVDLLLAGIDTTSFTTSFALYHLAKNIEVQNKLFIEAKELLPRMNDPVTSETLKKAHYVKAFLKESLRVNPISVGIGRILTQDIELSGYSVPKGTIVVTGNQICSIMPEYFDNPNTLLPERWIRNNPEFNSGHPFVSIPFGHGSRMCIARRLAEQNMHITILKMVRNFEISWIGNDLTITSEIINKPKGPVTLIFKNRCDTLKTF